MGTSTTSQDDVVDLSSSDGVTFISQSTPLTRLHYFDGKFLRADAFTLEQDYHRAALRLANLAGGWGVVDGLGVSLDAKDNGLLDVGAGLAITAAGSFVYAVGDLQAKLSELLAAATPAPSGGNADFGDCDGAKKNGTTQAAGLGIYEITVGPVEGQCGNEAVFGKVCESACVGDSQRPYWREGVVLRLRPITLQLPASSAVTLTTTHLRNRVASAYFAAEPWLTPSALSAAGLDSDLWCNPASLYDRDEVVIGLLVRDGTTTRVIDAWSGRRERMDTQARGYWQGRMAMRPWNVFVAQVLQFQCQLSGLFDGTGGIVGGDDCDKIRQLLESTRSQIDALHKRYSEGALRILKKFGNKPSAQDAQTMMTELQGSYADLYDISQGLSSADLGAGPLPANRMLLNAGFVELPPAGYLPVAPGQAPLADQLSRMFGEGVALTYHAVRHDEIAHLVEEAQHMDRISLTRGLDDPSQVEEVEVFVPDGTETNAAAAATGAWWQVELSVQALAHVDFGLKKSTLTSADGNDATKDGLSSSARLDGAGLLLRGLPHAAVLATAPSDEAESAPAGKTKGKAASPRQTTAPGPGQQLPAPTGTPLPKLPPFTGLIRTGANDGGGFGFTLVASADTASYVAAARAALAERRKDELELKPRQQTGGGTSGSGGTSGGVDDERVPVIYVAADISADPFALAQGAQAQITGETRAADVVSNLSGTLTVVGDRALPAGGTERLVRIVFTIDTLGEQIERQVGDLALRRAGAAAGGAYEIDDPQHDPSTPPLGFKWGGDPRHAVGTLLLQLAEKVVSIGTFAPKQQAGTGPTPAPGAGDPKTTAERVVAMDQLAAMPTVLDKVGAAAMNDLIRLGEASDDDAFVARARRRLFPTLDASPATVVTAVKDWVMFRRKRTLLCCPPTTSPVVAATIDTVKVWHVQVRNVDALHSLVQVLDRSDPSALSKVKFQQVGLLRYRDADNAPLETDAQVLGLWTPIKPGAQVVAGRYWENAPTTGQGWQNNFRLTAMLKAITSLTQPPAPGTGAIAPLVNVAPPLLDAAFDGGMLVVTMDKPAATRTALLVISSDAKPGQEHPISSLFPTAKMQFSGDAPVGDTLKNFIANIGDSLYVGGISLETVQAAPDGGAAVRAKAVAQAVLDAGKATPGQSLATLEVALPDADRAILKKMNFDLTQIDEVVYFEIGSNPT